ncbi:MAG: efflux RND transporter periplasmic adaptor subunit [Daejeonella sp.]
MKFQKKNTIQFALLCLTVLVFFSSCSENGATTNTEKNVSIVKSLEIIHPQMDRPVYTLSLPGELKPYEEVTIYPKIKGFVKDIYVDRGTYVKKGQLLAILEAPEVSQKYYSEKSAEQKFKEEYNYSRQSFDRLKQASKRSGAVAEMELERALSKVKSDSAAYRAAVANTSVSGQLNKYLRITAPFDGIVTERNISKGALVGENMSIPLFSVAQNNKLRLLVAIPEKHAASVNDFTKASFSVAGLPGKDFQTTIARTSSVLRQSSRSMIVEFDVVNYPDLNGGEYAQVKLKLQRPDSTYWVPASSVVNTQAGVFAVRSNDGIIERVPVIIGGRIKDKIEIFGDLKKTDNILKLGSEELTEGSRVTITK